VCYIINDLTNRELIRRKFKFEAFQLNENVYSEESDGIEEDDLLQSFAQPKETKGPKDLSEWGNLKQNNKKHLFEILNSEPSEDEFEFQFKGRTNLLNVNSFNNTAGAQTSTSEHSRRYSFNQTSNKRNLSTLQGAVSGNTIYTNNEILETSVDPNEWLKELERVKDHLSMPKVKFQPQALNDGDIEEINNRRLQIIEHTKVVKDFAESNIPILIENYLEGCQD